MDNKYENIIPWNGANDTGRDVRMKWKRNFEKVGLNFQNIDELLGLLADELDTKLSRTDSDTAKGIITFLKGLVSEEIIQALSGVEIGANGSGITVLENGASQAVVDYLYVKVKAVFDELEVKKKTYVGGEQVISHAGMKCIKVEELADAYRCYFKAKEDDMEIENQFSVGSLAIAQECNIKTGVSQHAGNRYYWRAVTSVGSDYIDLSKAECDKNVENDIPAIGDDIVGLGHKTDITRQGAIILSSVDEVAPSIIMYQGINDFSLAGKDVIALDFDKSTGRARMRVYGDTYIGARDRSSYIEFTPEGLKVKGKFLSTATGKDIDGLINEILSELELVKEQSDRELTFWFFDYEPTLFNIPASEWTTGELRTIHEEDLFYNIDSGFAYRFEKNEDGSYSWNSITDQQTVKALENAAKAQDTADGKRRTFVSQPTDSQPYDVGDQWVNATYEQLYSNDTLVCKTAKKAGETFSINHWQPSNKYTTAEINNLGDRITAVANRFNADGTLKNKSGLVITADFSKLFSEAVDNSGLVKKADISTFITKDDAGELISNAEINADKINFLGKTTINGNFVVDADGHVTMKNTTVTGTIVANNGKVGGFKISGNGLTNANDNGSFTNDAYVIFRNDTHKCFAGIGGNVLPASTGQRGVARFENHDKNDWWGLGSNYTMLVSAQGAANNCAIAFNGGYMSGVAVKVQIIDSATTISRSTVCVQFINTTNIVVNLPDMEEYDDGHVIFIKGMGSGLVRLVTGYGRQIDGKRMRNTFSSTPLLEKNVGNGESLRLIYSRDLTNKDGYFGCWTYF